MAGAWLVCCLVHIAFLKLLLHHLLLNLVNMQCLVIDNGASHIKYGMGGNENPDGCIPNCTAKIPRQMQQLRGDEINNAQDSAALTYIRPFDRGYVVNWNPLMDIWKYILEEKYQKSIDPINTSLVLSEAPFMPECIANETNEVVFEEFNFHSHARKPSSWFSAYEFAQSNSNIANITADNHISTLKTYCSDDNNVKPKEIDNKQNKIQYPEAVTVMDSGFSFTHCYPFIDLQCRKQAVKRLNVGGKLLTNYLKEIVSYRQYNMMDEFKLINDVKEALCYVSPCFMNDMRNSKKRRVSTIHGCTTTNDLLPMGWTKSKTKRRGHESYPTYNQVPVYDYRNSCLKKNYVLPDFSTVYKGYVKGDDELPTQNEQILTMETERIAVSELLFTPSDIGLNQGGIVETCGHSLSCLSEMELGLCGQNILLTGGNMNIPGLVERFTQEIRAHVPDIIPNVYVHIPRNPSLYAWRGASRFARNEIIPHITTNAEMNRVNEPQSMERDEKPWVTREEYLEFGHFYCNEKMKNW